MASIGPTSVSPVSTGEEEMPLSKIVLYAMIGAILFVLIIIIILVIFLCKRRKKNSTEIKDPSMQLKILDEDDKKEVDSNLLCGRTKKKKDKTKSDTAPPPVDLPLPPPYEPGTNIGGVYERISSADMDTKFGVSFMNQPNEKLENDVINTYVSIGRSNSFNPSRRDRPVVKKSREDQNNRVKRNESIKCIETGIVPSETDDIKVRVQELTNTEPNTRVKQKRTSTKKYKSHSSSPITNLKTHELVKITPPVNKKDLNKATRNTDIHNHKSKPPSVSGASVVSSNDSEAASVVGTDSGYEDINSESSPTARRHHLNIDETFSSENSNSNGGSPASSLRRNYIDVEVMPMPCSRLLQQRNNSIVERRNSNKPEIDHHGSHDNTRENSLIESNNCIYTQVTIDPQAS